MEFGLVFFPGSSTNVFGFVRYVLPDSDASTKGVERGMIFNTVDGQQITASNFRTLLKPDSYSIGLATFDGQNITPTGESISLIKTQITENPVFIAKTLNIQNQKIGYLMYNAFTADFDSQLNAAFGQFKSNNLNELILDLRYNGGGSVATAIDLSSMITGQFNGQLFNREEWNADRQEQFGEDNFFNNTIRTGEAINSLNLTKVYIITTKSSASASELVINGLNPYINVIQVGDVTTGKFQASILLYDAENFSRANANPNHKYAMLPLVLKTVNSVGFTDFINGLDPDIFLKEDFSNLGVLGDVNEPLLARTLEAIFPTPQKLTVQKEFYDFTEMGDSKMDQPLYQNMYKD